MAGNAWRWAAAGVAAVVLFEVALRLLWPRIDDNDPFPTLEQQLAVLAAIALAALPHVIAVLGYRGRPWLLKVAGVVALGLGIAAATTFTLTLLGIPLLVVPALFYFGASSRHDGRGRVPTLLLALVATLCAGGAVVSLFLTADRQCVVEVVGENSVAYRGDGCPLGSPEISGEPVRLRGDEINWSATSDAIVFHESLPSLGLTGLAIAFCVWGSGRPEGRKPAV